MIIRSLCNTCLQPFEVLVESGDADLIKQVATDEGQMCPCPRLCGGKINLFGDPVINEMRGKLKEPMTITGKELYQAVHGLGLRDEVVKDKAVVEALLKANKVAGVGLEEANGRLYLHELRLENGLTVHLAAGARGAQVLKVTKENADGPVDHR